MPTSTTVAFDPAKLMARVREETGIHIVDKMAIEPLTVLCKALREEGRLHADGEVAMERFLIHLLRNRLRMCRDFLEHPKIADEAILPPILISSSMRTGSTKIQRLLSAAGDFNWLPLWQSRNPSLYSGDPNESLRPRIDETDAWIEWINSVSPNLAAIHEYQSLMPEEESYIMEQSLVTTGFPAYTPMPSYARWLATQGLIGQVEYLRDTLKYLQWQGLASSSKRWLLKSPSHFGAEHYFYKVFPSAQFVVPHRHPFKTAASSCSLVQSFHVPFNNVRIDYPALFGHFAAAANRHVKVREKVPTEQFLDLSYHNIIKSPNEVIEQVYDFVGMPLTAEARQRMQDWEASHPQHKKGKHKYSLDGFGITEAQVEEAYGPYLAYFSDFV